MTLYETQEYQRDIGLEGVDTRVPRVNRSRALSACLFLIAVVYLLQILTPLRLNIDVIHFLSVAASVADGNGYIYYGKPTYYPHGYPAMLALLDRLGLAASWSFVGLNCLFVGLGMLMAYMIFRRHFRLNQPSSLLLVCLALLNYAFVKHVTLPLSDVPYFGPSMACVFVLSETERYTGFRRWCLLLVAAMLTGFSIWIRTVGIALIPALIWASIPNRSHLLQVLGSSLKSRSRKLLLIAASGAVVLAASILVSRFESKYFTELIGFYKGRSAAVLAEIARDKVVPLGEMLLNAPANKLAGRSGITIILIGVVWLFLLGFTFWRRRRNTSVVEIYVLAYTGIVLLWPGANVRFWMPVLPLLIGLVAVAVKPWLHRPFVRKLLPLYLAWVFLTGSAALAYSSYVTFSGSKFPSRYGGGSFKPAYQLFYRGGGEAEAAALKFDRPRREAVFILMRYGHRTRPSAQTP